MDDEQISIVPPYMLALPGVDQALSYHLRNRAIAALNEIEAVSGIQEDHPLVETAIMMDECLTFTQIARMN